MAGSSKSANTQSAKASSSSKNNKDEAIILYSEGEDADPVPPPVRNKTKPTAIPVAQTKPAVGPVAQANGKVAKGKGKTKETAPQQDVVEPMDVDDAPTANSPEPATRPKPRPAAKVPSKPHPQTRPKAGDSEKMVALEKENARLKKRLDDLTAIHETTVKQAQEALQVRLTEPERVLQETISQFEATIQTQEKLLEEQSKKLAQYGAAPQSGPSVQFLTRDAVDEEKKTLEVKLRQLEETVKKKDAQIVELIQKQSDSDKQLAYEIKLASEYRAKNPPGAKLNGGPRAVTPASASDPLQSEVVRFYEDLTNVLVTKVTLEPLRYPQWPDLKVYTFNCTYTCISEEKTEGTVNPSIQFNLRTHWLRRDAKDPDDPIPPSSRDELQAKCQYWPLNLDKETELFRERLDFFSDSFIFARDQMSVFFKTLGERLSVTQPENETEDEVEMIISAGR